MNEDRRTTQRANANLTVKWEGVVGSDSGTVSDLSVEGCFVLCSGQVMESEPVRLQFSFPDFKSVPLLGEVVYQVNEIGFALRFVNLTPAQVEFLRQLMAANADPTRAVQ
ncbi:MAG: PilZ domain-containing protein [Pyrinomonadaceae bacterium]